MTTAGPREAPSPRGAEPVRVGIYGTGRLAGSLARAVAGSIGRAVAGSIGRDRDLGRPIRLVGLSGRDPARVADLAGEVGAPALSPVDLVGTADLLLIVVADGAIAESAAFLAQEHDPGVRSAPLRWAVHCSGALSPEVLAPLVATGRTLGAWHPMQAFPTPATAPAPGVTWTITAEDPDLVKLLWRLTSALGGLPHALAAEHRAAYHAAAVMAANYPAALVAHAAHVLTGCGFTDAEALAALLPLARSALDGLAAAGVPSGITGPAVRGDVATITSHLRALDDRPATRALYRATGLGIVPLAQARGLPPEAVAHLRAALTDDGNLP